MYFTIGKPAKITIAAVPSTSVIVSYKIYNMYFHCRIHHFLWLFNFPYKRPIERKYKRSTRIARIVQSQFLSFIFLRARSSTFLPRYTADGRKRPKSVTEIYRRPITFYVMLCRMKKKKLISIWKKKKNTNLILYSRGDENALFVRVI